MGRILFRFLSSNGKISAVVKTKVLIKGQPRNWWIYELHLKKTDLKGQTNIFFCSICKLMMINVQFLKGWIQKVVFDIELFPCAIIVRTLISWQVVHNYSSDINTVVKGNVRICFTKNERDGWDSFWQLQPSSNNKVPPRRWFPFIKRIVGKYWKTPKEINHFFSFGPCQLLWFWTYFRILFIHWHNSPVQ